MKHTNVALFVPHMGCVHQCSFCNQKTISGTVKPLTPQEVAAACDIALQSGRVDCKNAEIAFFGGSFTAIERSHMVALLAAAKPYVDRGCFSGIRISTRPDCITEEILEILKAYRVTAIELGAQSMDDAVLKRNRRGHTAQQVCAASRLIQQHGFSLGLQMMTGLMGDTDETCRKTAVGLIALKPDTVRIYPTVVLKNTALAGWLANGSYTPQTLDEAVSLCAELLLMFQQAGIRVIRLGLHSGGGVDEGYLAGAYHPAFRELCEGRIYLRKMLAALQALPKDAAYQIEVPQKSLSKAKGQHKTNEKALLKNGFQCKIKGNIFLQDYEIKIKETEYDFKGAGDAGI